MEVEVRTVGHISSCFVGLPLHLIEALQATHKGFLPPFLVLELRPRDSSDVSAWHVAWSGNASKSNAIEVSEKLAECMCLPNHFHVFVRARADVPKAATVMLEPVTEDDWEILEVNAEFVEEHLLNQVGIVQEGLKFPLWLHGQTVITFHVISTEPEKLVVQLISGTEVSVVPKQRKSNLSSSIKNITDNHQRNKYSRKALLRVQELDRSLIKICNHGSVNFGVVPTTLAFVSAKTGDFHSLSNGQPVILTSLSGGIKGAQDDEEFQGMEKDENFSKGKQNDIQFLKNKKDGIQVICQIVFLDRVASGHVMLAKSLCRYMQTGPHKRVLVRECSRMITEAPGFLLSPVIFQSFEKAKFSQSKGLKSRGGEEDDIGNHTEFMELDSANEEKVVDWVRYKKFLSALVSTSKEENDNDLEKPGRKNGVLKAWLLSEISILSEHLLGQVTNSLVIGNKTFLHFEVYTENLNQGKDNGQVDTADFHVNWTDISDVMFVLSVADVYQNLENYELQNDDIDKQPMKSVEQLYSISNVMPICDRKPKLGKPLHVLCGKDTGFKGKRGPLLSSLSWMETAISQALDRLTFILSPQCGRIFSRFGLPVPGHVLLHGPTASGKTHLALALARHFEDNPEILAHIVILRCSELAGEQTESLRKALLKYVSEAIEHAPSIIVLDDLDAAISVSSISDGSEPSAGMIGLAECLADLMDYFQWKVNTSCCAGLVAFLGVVKSPGALPSFLCSSGRFDFHVQVSPPATKERITILEHEIFKRGLQCSNAVVADTALKCDGYDTCDLEVLVDRAVHAAAMRSLSPILAQTSTCAKFGKPEILEEDFLNALDNFVPAAMRGIAKSGNHVGHVGWEDVGGLFETRTAIKEMLELPVKFSEIFSAAPLRLRSGVLLYGPPGCGKTHIVGAAAAACSLRFISVKGPELLNKYIGASEQAVRDIFAKASAASPCILFFDEFDSIAPKRGHDNTGVTDRVVNQFLTELDGVESLTGVFVFAATSRPDLLDAALLRPGRLDRLLFCDFPSAKERLEILEVLSRKLSLANDVDLGTIASNTEGFSGADLQALLSDAQLESVHQHLERETNGSSNKPIITNTILESVLAKARPSVSENERNRLYAIYSEFQSSRTSAATKTRESKGKKSTLA
eukprot:TRINITY_DN3444_c0_g1_i8.p1 TRINITY_DN3444_c0_g1~~TRINITY_DN3444_c0_g1_i8.p1  ORF type:complete len:1188 (+),score=284.39 TRINITY_DN3444_c0_g1_i8:127-3564(+)